MYNIDKLFHLKDEKGNELSKLIEYEIKKENNEVTKYRFILIVSEEMLMNLKIIQLMNIL